MPALTWWLYGLNKFVLKLLLGDVVISAFKMNKFRSACNCYNICKLREDGRNLGSWILFVCLFLANALATRGNCMSNNIIFRDNL